MLAGNFIVKSSCEVTVDERRLVAHLAIERRKKMSSLTASTYFVNGKYILLILTARVGECNIINTEYTAGGYSGDCTTIGGAWPPTMAKTLTRFTNGVGRHVSPVLSTFQSSF